MLENHIDFRLLGRLARTLFCLVAALYFMAGPAVAAGPTAPEPEPFLSGGVLDLDTAVAFGLKNNPDTAAALAQIRKKQALLNMSEAPFWPGVSAYGQYTQGDAPSAYLFKTIDARKLPANANFNDPGWFENYETGIRARYNLYNGGKDRINREMAKSMLDSAGLDAGNAANQIAAGVIRAYYDALAAEALEEIAVQSVETVREELRIMTVRFNAGGALKSDVLSLNVRLARAREERVKSKNRKNLARAVLAVTLGLSPDTALVLEDPKDQTGAFPPTLAQGVKTGLGLRPEIKKAKASVHQAELALASARARYLPRVDLEAAYYLGDPEASFDLDRKNWTAGASVSWDIFTGFSRREKVSAARFGYQQATAMAKKLDLNVRLEIQTAYANFEEAEARHRVAVHAVEMADESLELVKQQYEGGSASITRYLEAQLSHTEAKNRETAARYDRGKAASDIRRAVGMWADRFPSEIRKK